MDSTTQDTHEPTTGCVVGDTEGLLGLIVPETDDLIPGKRSVLLPSDGVEMLQLHETQETAVLDLDESLRGEEDAVLRERAVGLRLIPSTTEETSLFPIPESTDGLFRGPEDQDILTSEPGTGGAEQLGLSVWGGGAREEEGWRIDST